MPTPAAAAPALPSPPGLPPRFRLLQRLGEGSAGTVYAAHDAERGEAVALKLLPLTDSGTTDLATLQARFRAEAETAQRLAHPDIVATLGAGSAGALAWLVLELVPGTTLARYTAPARLLPEPLVRQAGRRLAAALAHAHQQGVVHRDLKPHNVLVNWPRGVLKLGDFGLARAADGEATRTGLVLGSPAYMAPELLAGAAPSAATDLYALGVTLFELVAGRLPFEGGSTGALLQRVANEPAPDLRTLQAQTTPALAELVARLLAKRAGQRPPSATAVASALD